MPNVGSDERTANFRPERSVPKALSLHHYKNSTTTLSTVNEDNFLTFVDAKTWELSKGRGTKRVLNLSSVNYLLSVSHCRCPFISEVKKLVHEHRADDRVSFETFLPILQAIMGRRSKDTTDDFIEGLRHFDKGRTHVHALRSVLWEAIQ